MRGDFERDESVAASTFFPDRVQHVAAELDVGDSEFLEYVEGISGALRDQRSDGGVVVARLDDGLFEDRRIRGDTANALVLDPVAKLAREQEVSTDVVEPDRLAHRMGFEDRRVSIDSLGASRFWGHLFLLCRARWVCRARPSSAKCDRVQSATECNVRHEGGGDDGGSGSSSVATAATDLIRGGSIDARRAIGARGL